MNVPAEIRTILFGPQTAGGLLLSVARSDAASLLTALASAGVPAVEIGEVLPPGKPVIRVVERPLGFHLPNCEITQLPNSGTPTPHPSTRISKYLPHPIPSHPRLA